MTRRGKRATRTAVAAAALAAGVAGGLPSARAGPDAAGEATRGESRGGRPADAGYVELQRQVNELRGELLDERERRIERWQEANGFVLVILGVAIGIGGLWIYAKLRFIADGASIGALAAHRHAPVHGGLLPGAAVPPQPPADDPGPLPYLVAADPESAAVPPADAVVPAGQPGPGLDPEELLRHEEAIADCSEAIRLDPRNPALYLERAEARSAVARYEKAIADYDRAIRLDPDRAGAYLGRCRAKSELGRHEEAVEDYDHAVRLDPDSAAAVAAG